MAWIESHQKLEKSGKVFDLALKLRVSRYQVIGHLHALWWWALDNARNGDVTRYRNYMNDVTGWTESQNEAYAVHSDDVDFRVNILENLISCGFIDEIGDRLLIHDWSEYTHRYYLGVDRANAIKEQTKNRVREFRKRNANVTPNETLQKRSVTHIPDLTKPDLTKPIITSTKASHIFVKPTAIEVSVYAKTIGFELDGQKFIDHYESKGWVIGRSPMKSWQACVRNWKSNGHGGSNGSRTSSNVRLTQTDPDRIKAYES